MVSVFRLATARALVIFLVLSFHKSRTDPTVVGGVFGKPPLVSWFEGFGVFGGHFRVNVIGSIVGEPAELDPLGYGNGIMDEFIQVLSVCFA